MRDGSHMDLRVEARITDGRGGVAPTGEDSQVGYNLCAVVVRIGTRNRV